MALDIIGIFEIDAEAKKALDQLIKDGFSDTNITVSRQPKEVKTNKDYHYTNQDKDNEFVKFLDNIIAGHDEGNPENFIKPSEFDTKITVRVDTTSEAERAANIMEVYGSSNVNKKQGEFF